MDIFLGEKCILGKMGCISVIELQLNEIIDYELIIKLGKEVGIE